MLGDMFGGDGAGEGAMGLAELFSPDERRRTGTEVVVYERYLCGGPRALNINDR